MADSRSVKETVAGTAPRPRAEVWSPLGGRPGLGVWAALGVPLRWRARRRVHVSQKQDLFGEGVELETIDRVFAVMSMCQEHTFILTTRNPERMKHYLTNDVNSQAYRWPHIEVAARELWRNVAGRRIARKTLVGPLRNVWLGVIAEDQAAADRRIPILLEVPAARRVVCAGPLLGSLDLQRVQWPDRHKVDVLRKGAWDVPGWHAGFTNRSDMNGIDWVVVEGDIGPHARPMHPAWVRSLRDQCAAAGVPFTFGGWGEFVQAEHAPGDLNYCYDNARSGGWVNPEGSYQLGEDAEPGPGAVHVFRLGKNRSGRQIDGVIHDAEPARIE